MIDQFNEVMQQYGADYKDFNIVGIRCDDDALNDSFDDLLLFFNGSKYIASPASTVPGKWWTQNPVTDAGVTGAGRLAIGYYPESHTMGIHGASHPDFAHEAWCQTGVLKYYRDVNKNGIIEFFEPLQSGSGKGFNIHRASAAKIMQFVDKWSAGCQVSQNHKLHEAGIQMAKESMDTKNPISYLLTKKEDWQNALQVEDIRAKLIKGL